MASVAKAWLGLATISVLVVVLVSDMMTDADNQFIRDTTNRFSKLSRADLLNAWHAENHKRCRRQLTWTIDLACRFDPYRINTTRHRRRAVDKPRIKRDVSPNKTADVQPLPDIPHTISKKDATSILKDKKYEKSLPKVYVRQECSWEEIGLGCRVLDNLTGKLLSLEEIPKIASSAPSPPNDQGNRRSQKSVPVKEECTGKDSRSDCKKSDNLREIPFAITKKIATAYLSDEKRRRIRSRVYIKEGCSWEEFGKGCMVRSILTEETIKRYSRKEPISFMSYQQSRSSQQNSEVASCSREQYGEGCKRHPRRENELAQFTSKKSALSFTGEKRPRQGKQSPSIMEECCLRKGCFWEEYGEFCHEHPRRRTELESVCPIK